MSNDKIDRYDGSEPAITSPNQLSPRDARPEDFAVEPAIPLHGQQGDSLVEYRRLVAANRNNPVTGKAAPTGPSVDQAASR